MKYLLSFILAFSILLSGRTAGFAAEESLQEITVQDGDTLWGVANKYLKDPQSWPQLLKYNSLASTDPNVILPGMKLKVPVLMIREEYRSAVLIQLMNSVMCRRKNTTDWELAKLNMLLYNSDSVRTLSDSLANVKFYSGEVIKLDQNSLVILRPEKKQDEVELLNGGVRASRSRIISAASEIMPRVVPRQESNPDFKTKISSDKTTLIEVYQGTVDVTAQGKTVTLTKGFGTEVKYLQTPAEPRKLPPQIALGKNAVPSISKTGELALPPELEKNLARGAEPSGSEGKTQVLGSLINKYRLQISPDKNFQKVLFENEYLLGKSSVDFKKLDLPDGAYFYRISYIDELGLEGPYSEALGFILDRNPPEVTIAYPTENSTVDTQTVLVKGKTEPGTTLEINDDIVSIDMDGSFSKTVEARAGKNTLHIKSKDSSGNERTLEYSFLRTAEARPDVGLQNPKKKGGFSFTPGGIALGVLSLSVIVGVVLLIIG